MAVPAEELFGGIRNKIPAAGSMAAASKRRTSRSEKVLLTGENGMESFDGVKVFMGKDSYWVIGSVSDSNFCPFKKMDFRTASCEGNLTIWVQSVG